MSKNVRIVTVNCNTDLEVRQWNGRLSELIKTRTKPTSISNERVQMTTDVSPFVLDTRGKALDYRSLGHGFDTGLSLELLSTGIVKAC